MVRKKGISPIIIPARSDDFVPIDHESGKCLLCNEWLGVNCEEHNGSTSDKPKHFPQTGPPFTPHIVVSRELAPNPTDSDDEEEETENQPKVDSPTENTETYNFAPPKSPEEVVDQESPKSESVYNFNDDQSVNESLIVEIDKSTEKLNTTEVSEATSTEEIIPIEEDPNFYDNCSHKNGVHMPKYQGPYENAKQIKSIKNENSSILTLSASSTNVSALDPFEYLQRKTRRNSMLNMMRKTNSQNTMVGSFNLHTSASSVSLVADPIAWKEESNDSLMLCLSALYGKLLVVLGMAFPIAQTISSTVPSAFYNIFYLFLYFGSIFFLVYAYLFLLRVSSLPMAGVKSNIQNFKSSMTNLEIKLPEIPFSDRFRKMLCYKSRTDRTPEREEMNVVPRTTHRNPKYTLTESSNHGSMYLKMGAVVFGVGSMIYSGLEFGQFFDLIPDTDCDNIIMAITPIGRMLFTFLQMYFIFLNSRVAISKHTNIARFGLMHMIATNLCIWQSVLVQETKHEIAHLVQMSAHSKTVGLEHKDYSVIGNGMPATTEMTTTTTILHGNSHHDIVERSIVAEESSNCRRSNLMGAVVSSASPFLFPCTIEYSLLCAGVLYVMWKNINALKSEKSSPDGDSDISNFIARKVRHHYSVDCARASRGLFIGIFLLVLTIISLILFYVLISNEEYKYWAIMEANIIEITIYSMAIISLLIAMKQMRQLEFILEGDIELDNILLLIAQGGVYIYTSFTIIGGCFTLKESPLLPMITAFLTLVQTTLQTIFILDGSRRCCYTSEQHDKKPGREMVTFLLVCNLAMWAISTFETSRADAHPVQLDFYGIWAWTIISHVSMPLAIFYRFHVTVCLGEIWKRAYKVKQDFFNL